MYSLFYLDLYLVLMHFLHSLFFDHLYIPKLDNGFQSIMRNIDWNRGMPYTWREEDFEELINSNYLFARKFDETVDSTIIELISDYILKR